MKSPLYFSCAALVATALSLGGLTQKAAAQGAPGVAYITSQDGDISVLSLDTLAINETIHADGKAPRGLGVTSDGKYLVTANRDGGDISVIDLATKKVIKHIPIGKNPEFVRVQGDQAFISFEPSSVGGPPPKKGEKKAETKDDDDDLLPAKIAIVDLKKLEVISEVTSGPETEGIEFTPDGKAMLVTNEADNTVTVYELPDGKLIKTIDTHEYGDRPRGIKVSPDGMTYVVTLEFGNKVLILDKDLEPVKSISTGESPYGVSFDRSGKRLFVAASKAKEIQVFDGKTFEPIKNIPVKDRCWHFSFSPDDSKIVVACGRSNNVLVFDSTSYELLKDVPVKDMPWGVVTYPKAMGSLDQP
ncbi:MAG: beta-propeller fold lactonase family protein [Hyphomicrobiaceae bacterium]